MSNQYLDLLQSTSMATGGATGGAPNPYLDLLQGFADTQRAQQTAQLSQAVKVNPEQYSAQRRVAGYLGYPVAAVEMQPALVDQAKVQKVQQDIAGAPVLQSRYTDADFAKLAHDDSSTLATLETAVGKAVRYMMGAAPGGGVVGDLKASLYRSAGAVAGTKRAAVDVIEPWARLVAGDDNWFAQMSQYYAREGASAEEMVKRLSPPTDSTFGSGVSSGVQSFGQNAKYLPLALAGPGGAALALGGMVMESFGSSYNKAADKNLPLWQSLGYASADAMVEYWTEKLPLDALIGGLRQGAPFIKLLGKQMALEIPGEQLATVLQDLNEWATLNPGKPFKDYLAERPDAAAQTLIATVIGTGGNVAVTSSIANVLDTIGGTQWRQNVSQGYADLLQEQLRLAGQSALRERSPEQFRALVQQITETREGAPKAVYVDGEVLQQLPAEVFNQLPAAVQSQVGQAAATGDVVEIPMADVLTVAPGTELEQVLNQHARVDPFAMSLAESQAAGERAQEFLKAEAERVVQQAADQEALRQSQELVKTNIKQQLAATGRFRDAVNEGYATWAAAFYTAYGSRLGLTPEQFYAKYPLRVLGAPVGQQTGVLNAEADFFNQEGRLMGINVRSDNAAGMPYADAIVDGMKLYETRDNDSLRPYVGQRVAIVRTGEGQAKAIGEVTIGEPILVDEARFRELQDQHLVPPGSSFDIEPGGQKYLYPMQDPVRYDAERDVGAGIVSRQVLNQDAPTETPTETLQGDEVEPSDDVAAIVQSEIPDSVDAGATLENTLQLAKGKVWQKGRDLKIAMQEALQKLAQAAGVNVGAPSPQTTEYLVRVGLKDALFALEQNANAIGWYDLKTRQALAVMSLVHPEIATDQNAQLAFVWALAVTSNGLKVGKNFEIAEQVYRQWKASAKKVEDRRMPDNVGIGTAKNAINKSLALFNTLRDSWGTDDLRRFMLSNFTVGEITAIDKALKPGGEHADVTVRGAAILGPKIGNGFFSNLYGNFSALTMDRWLIRTWGRWTGTLIKPMPVQTAKARDRLSAVLQQITADETERARLSTAINAEITAAMPVDELAVAVQEASVDPAVREVLNQTDTGLELRKAGNSLAKYLDGQKEAPAGPTERKYIREVFGRILDELRQNPKYAGLTMADLQAVLWYAEKRLYESAKQDLADDDTIEGYSDDEAPDYANAAAEVARKAGVTDRRINLALNKEANRGRPADARPGDGAEGSQAVTGQQESAAGFTRQDKKFFIGARAVLRVRSNRDGAGQSSGSYTRTGDGGRGKARVLKALGVTYVEEWKLSRSAGTVFKANNLAAPQFIELAPGDATNAQRFADAITTSKQSSGAVGAAVYVYPTEDYAGMRLFLARDGKSGFALKPDGDIVSVFSQGGAGRAVMELAVSAGGKKLDAFDTILPGFYSAHGFVAVSRLTWDDSQAPEGWDKAALARYNNGQPDVVFMVYDPTFTGGYSSKDGRRQTGDNAYGDALAAQDAAMRKVARAERERARAARHAAAQAQAPAQGAPLAQGARGTFNPQTLELVLNPNADLSTWFHETGHFFLEVLADVASQPDAPAQIAEDYAKVLAWFGVTPEQWAGFSLDEKRPYHERWAESIEQYVMEGKAPSVELQGVMRRFRAWLTSVYQSVKAFVAGKPELELNDDIRRVMDRMLATDDQVAQANEVAGFMPNEEADGEAAERLQKRSMADLKWAVKARDKVIAKLKKQAREIEKALREQVTVEVDQMPEMRAKAALDALAITPEYAGILAEHKAQRQAAETQARQEITDAALAAEQAKSGELKGLKKGQFLAKMKREIGNQVEARMIEWDRANPRPVRPVNATDQDVATIADSFGFESVEAMMQAIDAFGSRADAIDGLTEQRMLEEHGDLIDERAIQEAANEAVHNEARARSLATELRTQREMLGQRTDTGEVNARGARITVNTLLEAAKQFGARVIARTPLKDLRSTAWKHTAAERRAGKRWAEATAAGDTAAAVQAKQDQVLNNAAAKAALDAAAEAKKILEFFARVTKGNDEKVVEKGRDPDIVNAARAVLAAYGIETPTTKGAAEYLETLKTNDPETYAAIEPMVTAATQNAQPLQALTFEELQGLAESIQAMWYLAKRSRQMEVDGDLLDIDEVADEVYARMEAIGIPDTVPGESGALTKAEERGRMLQFAGALLRRVEQWAEAKDGLFGGPFLRYIFQPVKDAADRYRADRIEYRKKFQALVDNIAPTMRPGLIDAPEFGYTFGRGHNGIGMAELLHAILHTGNASNKRKLLLGRGWATENPDGTLDTSRWDAFLKRMHDTGVLQREHWDFAQGVWDLMEATKPLAQKTHRDVFGRYFEEVTAEAFETPFGSYRGGYVPAQADPLLVQDAELRDLLEGENASMAYAFPQTNRGFTKARVEYNRPLKLDLRTLPQHIDKVLLFSHMEPAVRGVARLIKRPKVSQPLGRIDPAAISGLLRPWLNRSARQIVETPVIGDGRIARIAAIARARAGMTLMIANLSNTLQQITGLSTAAVKVKPAHLMRAVAAYIARPKQTSQAVWEASSYMADRASNETAVMQAEMEKILLDPSAFERAQDWTGRHAYFLQTAFDNVLSPIVWTGAYNQAIEEGMDERMAIRYADGVVRQTQGSTLPEDVSRFETGPAYARLFTQFVGYFNMMANTNATALQQIAGEVGLKKGAGKALYVVLMGLLMPIWVAEAIALAFKGGADDKEGDGWLDDWLAAVFGLGTIKGLLAQVPVIGQLTQVAVSRFNDNPADDRFSLSPAVSLLESAAGSPASVYQAIVEDGNRQKAIRDVASLVSLATGLPAYALARPLGYGAAVQQGKVEPTGAVDAARGLLTGTASPESKAR